MESSAGGNTFHENACAALCGVRVKNAHIWAQRLCGGHTSKRWHQTMHLWAVVSGGIGAHIGTALGVTCT